MGGPIPASGPSQLETRLRVGRELGGSAPSPQAVRRGKPVQVIAVRSAQIDYV